GNRNYVAWLHDSAAAHRRPSEAIQPLLVLLLDLITSAVEVIDEDHLRKRSQSADMIGVEVANDQVVDFLQAGLLGRGVDSFGVAIADRPSRVDEQRLSGRRHDQSGRAAFDVDPIYIESFRGRGFRESRDRHRGAYGETREYEHVPPVFKLTGRA